MKPKLTQFYFLDTFGELFHMMCELKCVRQHGFNTPIGGWAAYPNEGDTPAFFALIREKGHRKAHARNVNTFIHPTPEQLIAMAKGKDEN